MKVENDFMFYQHEINVWRKKLEREIAFTQKSRGGETYESQTCNQSFLKSLHKSARVRETPVRTLPQSLSISAYCIFWSRVWVWVWMCVRACVRAGVCVRACVCVCAVCQSDPCRAEQTTGMPSPLYVRTTLHQNVLVFHHKAVHLLKNPQLYSMQLGSSAHMLACVSIGISNGFRRNAVLFFKCTFQKNK